MIKNKHWGSTFDDFLREEGIYEEVTAAALKSVLADQLAAEMKKKKITRKRMAKMMQTTRAQLNRFLDPEDDDATLESLMRAAKIVGRELRVGLV